MTLAQYLALRESAGRVDGEPEQTDRRRHPLTLTPVDFAVFQAATRRVYGALGDVLAGLPPHEARAVTDLLVTLEHVLAGSPPPRRSLPPRP